MRVVLRHRFPCDPATLWDLFEDPEFERRLTEATGLKRELLEARTESDGTHYSRLRCTSGKELPAFAQKAIGAPRLVYDQESRLDRTSNTLRWDVSPHVLPGRVTARGVTTVKAVGDGCERVIDGEFVVRVPLIGGKLEALLAKGLEESYDGAAAMARRVLAERSS